MIKSLDLTKNANNLYISVKQRSKDKTTSFTNIGQAILCKHQFLLYNIHI